LNPCRYIVEPIKTEDLRKQSVRIQEFKDTKLGFCTIQILVPTSEGADTILKLIKKMFPHKEPKLQVHPGRNPNKLSKLRKAA